MLQEFISSWKNIFNFHGRTRRREYWVAYLWNMAIAYLIVGIEFFCASYLISEITTGKSIFSNIPMVIITIVLTILLLVYTIFITILQISMSIRRCHDIGYSGWAYLLCVLGSLCCGIGGIVWFVFCCLDSKEDNQWGPNPKKEQKYKSSGSIVLAICAFVVSMLAYVVTLVIYIYSFAAKTAEYTNGLDDIEYNYTIDEDEIDLEDNIFENKVTQAEFTGEDWQSFEFAIDGKVLTLPCSYEDIQALGFSVQEDDIDEILENDQYTNICYVEDEKERGFYISFLNVSGSDKPIRECDVYSVRFDDFYNLTDVEICGGLTMGMSIDEVKALEGETPDYEYLSEEGDYQSVAYYYEGEKFFGELDVATLDGKVSTIELENRAY